MGHLEQREPAETSPDTHQLHSLKGSSFIPFPEGRADAGADEETEALFSDLSEVTQLWD